MDIERRKRGGPQPGSGRPRLDPELKKHRVIYWVTDDEKLTLDKALEETRMKQISHYHNQQVGDAVNQEWLHTDGTKFVFSTFTAWNGFEDERTVTESEAAKIKAAHEQDRSYEV